jgi:protein ImuA
MQRPSENPSISVEMLRQQIARIEGAKRHSSDSPVSSGCAAMDDLLPERGFRRGTLAEWLADDAGTGATLLAVLAAREACRRGGTLVVVERQRQFYPPAAVWLGIAPRRLLLVHADERADHDWALNQALRCPAVAAVLAWPETLGGRLDERTFRRLQLAAEESGSLGLFIRPASVRHEPSWADVRWLVEPRPADWRQNRRRRMWASLVRCRGGVEGQGVELEFDDETCTLHKAARLAPAAVRHAGRA